jgi:glycosyltransferase involved in cell wall biosynthesis
VCIVWAAPHRGTRSAWLASELGVRDVRYFSPTKGRGLRAAPLKYPSQLIRTVFSLLKDRPRVVLVQSPPSFAAWVVAAYSAASGAAMIIDAHSDAFERSIWTRPAWLTRAVARRASTTLVTNEHWARTVRSWGASAINVPSVPTDLAVGAPPPMPPGFNVTVVNTWQPDEPLGQILQAAEQLADVTFHVTGSDERLNELPRRPSPNVRFTGFLPQEAYHALLAGSHAVVCLTTRDHTMQNGAAEALSLGVPIVTSGWDVLRDYFSAGTVHVDNTATGIAAGIREILDSRQTYLAEIQHLRAVRRDEWHRVRAQVVDRVLAHLDPAIAATGRSTL